MAAWEAMLIEECRYLPLEAGTVAWAAVLPKGRRMRAADVPNIWESAKWLEERYTRLTNQRKDR